MITLTESAANQIRAAAGKNGEENLALRFAIEKKPDGAFHYLMGFDAAKDGDITITSLGIDIVFAADQQGLLSGMKVDYVEMNPGQFHFIFLNPNDPTYQPPDEGVSQHDLGSD